MACLFLKSVGFEHLQFSNYFNEVKYYNETTKILRFHIT